MHKALHSKDNIDRLYVSRKVSGRGLASIEDSVNAAIRGLEDNIKKTKEKLFSAISNSADKGKQNNNNKDRKMGRKTTVFQATNWRTVTRHGYRRENLKGETESPLIAAQKIRHKDQLC